jgi:hypothetical protein
LRQDLRAKRQAVFFDISFRLELAWTETAWLPAEFMCFG